MAVIVHHQGVAQHLGIQPRPSRPERPQADGDVEQSVGMGAHRGQRRDLVLHRQTGNAAGLGGAARQRAKRSDQQAAVQHQLLPF